MVKSGRSRCWHPIGWAPSPSPRLFPILKWFIRQVTVVPQILQKGLFFQLPNFFSSLSLDNSFACELSLRLPRRPDNGLDKHAEDPGALSSSLVNLRALRTVREWPWLQLGQPWSFLYMTPDYSLQERAKTTMGTFWLVLLKQFQKSNFAQ